MSSHLNKQIEKMWQRQFALREYSKGCHLITDQVLSAIEEGLKEGNANGLLHLFVQHTSCALSLNENYDPDVRRDMDMALNHIVPDTLPWRHTDEGPDDSSSHTKSALIGASITIPITNHVPCSSTATKEDRIDKAV